MNMENRKIPQANKKNSIQIFLYKYLPYWPLFVLLMIISLLMAYAYLQYATPIYEISANIMVKDEKKGADDAKLLEALNIYSSTKIVENEIEVIQSKELIKKVINNLHLYAPIYEEVALISKSAYTTSPIIIELQKPGQLTEVKDVDFTFNKKKQTVQIGDSTYPLDQWISSQFGKIRFSNNPELKNEATGRLYFSLVDPRMILSGLSMNLKASPSSKLSTVINLSLKDEVPERGEDILNYLIQVYNKAAMNDKNMLAYNTLEFVENRIKYVVRELDSIESNLQRFKSSKGVFDLSEQGKLYLQSVGDNDRKLTEINMQLAMLDEIEKYVVSKNSQIGIVPSTAGIQDELLAQLLQKQFNAQIQYDRMKKTVPVENPTMVALKSDIDNMQPSILDNIRSQRNSLLASRAKLNSGSDSYRSMLSTIPRKEQELLNISRQQAIKNEAYSFLLQKREETALAYSAVVSDSRTINQANASFDPVSPKPTLAYLSAFALAMLVGFIVVVIKEIFTNKILFRSDIENITAIPIAAEITRFKSKNKSIAYTIDNKQQGLLEQFRQLRAAIGFRGRQLKYRKILVTSSISGEGKSFICNNLALNLALAGKKVVVMDMDLRHPKTTMAHQLTGKKGVAEYLESDDSNTDSIIYPTKHPNLFVIPAGKPGMNPTEILLSKDPGRLIEYLQQKFDFVVIDTSPTDPVTDAFILSEYCDCTMFVIRHDYTPKSMVELLEETNKMNALKNIYIVFNGIRSRGFIQRKFGYGYGYGWKKVYGDSVYRVEI